MDGSIEKRGKNSYRLSVSNGFDSNGKRIIYKKTIHCSNKKEAKDELHKFCIEIKSGNICNNNTITLKEYSDFWFKNYCNSDLGLKTIIRYKSMLNVHILPKIGNMKLNQIKPIDITNLLSHMQYNSNSNEVNKKKLSNNTIIKAYYILSKMFNDAVYYGYITENIIEKVKKPKSTYTEIEFYTHDDVNKLIKYIQDEPLIPKTIITLAVMTGMRRGEIFGLHWNDINFNDKTLSIRRSAQYICGKKVFEKSPKTNTSNRNIVLPEICIELLKLLKEENEKNKLLLKNKYTINDNIFVNENGEILNPDYITKWFNKFIKRKNLPKITFHGLRHTSATFLLTEGINIKAVSTQLGHSNIAITNRYVHALQKNEQIANIFDSLYKKSVPNLYPTFENAQKKYQSPV